MYSDSFTLVSAGINWAMIDFYCFENMDKTNRFDSDWGTRQKRYKNKNIMIITSKESRVDHDDDDQDEDI